MVTRRNGQLARRIAITNCHLPLLVQIATWFGGRIHVHRPVKHYRTSFQWYCYGPTMVQVLTGLRPYLPVKRDEAELCLAFDAVRGRQHKPGQPLTPAAREQYQQLLARVDQLRRRSWSLTDVPVAFRARQHSL